MLCFPKVLCNWVLQVQTVYCKHEMILCGQSEDIKLVHLN